MFTIKCGKCELWAVQPNCALACNYFCIVTENVVCPIATDMFRFRWPFFSFSNENSTIITLKIEWETKAKHVWLINHHERWQQLRKYFLVAAFFDAHRRLRIVHFVIPNRHVWAHFSEHKMCAAREKKEEQIGKKKNHIGSSTRKRSAHKHTPYAGIRQCN